MSLLLLDKLFVTMFRLHRTARSTSITMSIDLLLACYLANAACAIANVMTALIFIILIVSLAHAFFLVVPVRSSLHTLMVVAGISYFQHIASVDGTHCRIEEPTLDSFEEQRKCHSRKFESAGLDYEVALSLYQQKCVWIKGPYPAGKPDITVFRKKLKKKIKEARAAAMHVARFRTFLLFGPPFARVQQAAAKDQPQRKTSGER